MPGHDELEGLRARLRTGAALSAPDVQEIRPEIRSAGTWHLIDTMTPTPAAGGPAPAPDPAAQNIKDGMAKGHLLGMMVRQVTYRVLPEDTDAFHAWLFRSEAELGRLAEAEGVLYRGTYGVFGRLGFYSTIWGFRSFEAIRNFSHAVADADAPLGAVLREMQNFADLRDPDHYQDHLLMPAASGRSLTPVTPGPAKAGVAEGKGKGKGKGRKA